MATDAVIDNGRRGDGIAKSNSATFVETASVETASIETAFIETAKGSFKPIAECSKGEIAAEIMAMLTQAESLLTDAREHSDAPDLLATAHALLHEAQELGDYLNV